MKALEKSVRQNVYILTHVVRAGTDDEEFKMLGVFSSRSNAESALRAASRLPGFCECKDGFNIARYHLDKMEWAEGFFTTFYPDKGLSGDRKS
jgi:hypothetical protein